MGREPSYPDRARIDSDVREFLRPVSTPWIVFDRDSRVDDFAKSALRVGAVFASSPNFRPEVLEAAKTTGRPLEEIVATPLPGLQAPPSIKSWTPPPMVAPAIVERNFTDTTPVNVTIAPAAFTSRKRAPRRTRAIAVGIGALLGVAAFVSVTAGRSRAKAAPAVAAVAVAAPLAVEEAAPPSETVELDDAPALADAPKKAMSEVKHGLGRLVIREAARHKNVYFDGKRMLGQGTRSFLVACGMHTIAVTDKTDAKDIEIPCNGEYVVFK